MFVKRKEILWNKDLNETKRIKVCQKKQFWTVTNCYWIVSTYITHNCWCFNKISLQVIKYFPNRIFFNTELRKVWLRESKAYSIFIVARTFSISNQSVISIVLKINPLLFPLNLFYVKAFVMKILTLQLLICWTQLSVIGLTAELLTF